MKIGMKKNLFIKNTNKYHNQKIMFDGHTFDSIKEAATALKIDSSTITKCCKGKLKHCGGFRWEYANE